MRPVGQLWPTLRWRALMQAGVASSPRLSVHSIACLPSSSSCRVLPLPRQARSSARRAPRSPAAAAGHFGSGAISSFGRPSRPCSSACPMLAGGPRRSPCPCPGCVEGRAPQLAAHKSLNGMDDHEQSRYERKKQFQRLTGRILVGQTATFRRFVRGFEARRQGVVLPVPGEPQDCQTP
jgi:hypothetical protein